MKINLISEKVKSLLFKTQTLNQSKIFLTGNTLNSFIVSTTTPLIKEFQKLDIYEI